MLTLAQILSVLGNGFSACAMAMTRMIPLRVMVIVGNVFLILYGVAARDYPSLALYGVLLLVNVYRLRQMQAMVAKVEKASSGAISKEWLSAFTRRRTTPAGELLFSRGDEATELYYVVSGLYRIPELKMDMGPGAMIGEFGLLSPGGRRLQSLQCVERGELLVVSYDEVHELFFQNPEFGYNFMRMVGNRLFSERDRLIKELAARPPADAPPSAA